MGHVDTIKQLFGRFKKLNERQIDLRKDVDFLKQEIISYPKDHVQVLEADSELVFILGKSDAFTNEFEKLRVELNSYKNAPNPQPELAVKFDEKLSFIEKKQKEFSDKVGALKEKVSGFQGTIDRIEKPVPAKEIKEPDADTGTDSGPTAFNEPQEKTSEKILMGLRMSNPL